DALARGELPRGRSLRTLLRPETWGRLAARYKGRVPPATLDRMGPWFAVLTLPLVAAPGGTGAGVSRRLAPILDAAIVARAKAHGARVMALDTPLEGIEAFSAIGRKEGARMLEQLLTTDVESQRHEIEGLIGAYVSDDDRHLVKAFGRLWRREPAVAEQILFRRNERWCERLALWLGDGGVFVAAGTFHMFGTGAWSSCCAGAATAWSACAGSAPSRQGARASSSGSRPSPQVPSKTPSTRAFMPRSVTSRRRASRSRPRCARSRRPSSARAGATASVSSTTRASTA